MLLPRKPGFLFSGVIVLMTQLTGCASFRNDFSDRFTRHSLWHEYRAALEAYDRGEYGSAIARFESLRDRYPADAPERGELLYREAQAQFALKNYHDAENAVKHYLELYPSGAFRAEASQDLVRISAARAAPSPVAEERLQESKTNLEKLLALEKEHPADPQIKYYIGNLHYELGNYKDAGKYYFQAQAFEAAYKEKELIQERLYINAQGEPEALTPAALRLLERDRSPLVVFDQKSYYERSNQDAFAARQAYATVTGKVRNQGTRPVRNVEIEVRFLNPTNDMLDFQVVRLGTLHPSEVRPFLAYATHYDNLLNISRVEVFARENR